MPANDPPAPRIFVSYRRKDCEAAVGRLVDELRRAFPRNLVFQDWSSIAPGVKFDVALQRELAHCTAVLVAIGPRWLSTTDSEGRRRLDDPDDWVRREVAECLARDVPMFPVLLDDAEMPPKAALPEAVRDLHRLQAMTIPNRHWDKDVGALVELLRPICEPRQAAAPAAGAVTAGVAGEAVPPGQNPLSGGNPKGEPKKPPPPPPPPWGLIGLVATVVVVGLAIFFFGNRSDPLPPPAPAAKEDVSPAAVPTPAPAAQGTRHPQPQAVSPPAAAPAAEAAKDSPAAKPSLAPATKEQIPTPPRWTAGQIFRDCPDCPEMVVVPAGEFMMGSPEGEGHSNEKPRHRVRIAQPFAVGRYEVSFAEWDACVAAGDCGQKPDAAGWGRGSRPVMNVSWDDAQQYLKWLSGKTGQTYQLLTEAEWEYAARAGSPTRYPWGDEPGGSHANFDGSGSRWSNKQTAPVGSFAANAFGLHDMIGNVWEWTQDCYRESYAGAPADGTVRDQAVCDRRVVRGGSWVSNPVLARSAIRNWFGPGIRVVNLGFRLARTL